MLDAGQDSEEINLHYATDEDIIVNQGQVASVKTIERYFFRIISMALLFQNGITPPHLNQSLKHD